MVSEMRWTQIWFSLLFLFVLTPCFSATDKIISADPAVTDMLVFLEAEKYLVAKSDYCASTPNNAGLPSIGSPYNFNYEKAVELEATKVMSSYTSLSNFKRRLQDLKINLVEFRTRSIGQMLKNLTKIDQMLKLKKESFFFNFL